MQNQITQAKRILPLIDLTSLNDNDDDDVIRNLCNRAIMHHIKVAAVCVFPQFVVLAKKCLLNSSIKVATVVNFPDGNQDPNTILTMTQSAIEDGANEIDLVIPYKDYLMGNTDTTKTLIREVKNICGQDIILKAILETGALLKSEIIAAASHDAILAGCDFLKTSTGKISIGATKEAAKIMLQEIHTAQKLGYQVGFKASGGIRTIEQAMEYLSIAESIMGSNWVSPQTFRFGASGLLNSILDIVGAEDNY